MKWFKRFSLFILTNILVIATISIVSSLIFGFLGINPSAGNLQGLMILCLLWGMGGSLISLLMSKFMAKHAYGVKIIDPNTMDMNQRQIVQMVHGLAIKAGLRKMPEVGIYDSPDINAFATGPSRNNSLVALSTGLLTRMNREEIEGVIGHEVAHVANGDMVTMTLIQGIVNAFAMFFSRILARIIASNFDERAQHGIMIGLSILFDIAFTILGSILVSYFSRQREYRADYGGAKFAGRDKMIAGLRKLQAQYPSIAPDDHAMAALRISNKSVGIQALFSTHPPLADRIRRLETAVIQ